MDDQGLNLGLSATTRSRAEILGAKPVSKIDKRKTNKIIKGQVEYSFAWEAKDMRRKIFRGEIVAVNEEQVKAQLRQQGLLPLKIRKKGRVRPRKIDVKQVVEFTRQLSVMLKSGIPLMQSLDIIGKGHSNPGFTKLISKMRADIEGGSSLADTFSKSPKQFDDLYCNLVSAGEASGSLDAILERLANYKQKTYETNRKIRSAFMYPIIVMLVLFIVITLLMIKVIPVFQEMYSASGELPAPTQMVVWMSEVFREYWMIIIPAPFLITYAYLYWISKSPTAHKRHDQMMLKLPIFGELVQKASLARWSRTFATLFAAGIPIAESFDSIAGAAGNDVIRDATLDAKEQVKAGVNLKGALINTHQFPNLITQMIGIGEESGSLDEMLNKVAEGYEFDVDVLTDNISTLIEPIAMVVVGSIVGFILVAMYLPIFKMGQTIG